MLQNVDLNKLRVFLAVMNNKSITEAAHQLNVSPSAISQSLRALESEIGFKLYERINKKLLPTLEAEKLGLLIQGFEKNLSLWATESNNKKKELSGTLRIGAPPELGSRKLITSLKKFAEKKLVNFKLELGLPDKLMEKLYLGQLDFALCDNGPHMTKYKSSALWKSIFDEETILVCSSQFYKQNINQKITYDDLIKLDHIDYRDDAKTLAIWYKHHFKKIPNELKLRLVVGHVGGVIAAAKAGFGLAFVPTYLVEEDLKKGLLVKIKTQKSEFINSILLVQMKDKVPSVLEKQVFKILENGIT